MGKLNQPYSIFLKKQVYAHLILQSVINILSYENTLNLVYRLYLYASHYVREYCYRRIGKNIFYVVGVIRVYIA